MSTNEGDPVRDCSQRLAEDTAHEQRDEHVVRSRLDPPELMNGSVRPLSGISRVTPPRMMNTCMPKVMVRPAASRVEKSSRAPQAIAKPRPTMTANSRISAVEPSSPSSSPSAEKMKSFSTSGMRSAARPWPRPVPAIPPAARANSDCTSWNPLSLASANGSSQVLMRRWTWPNTVQAAKDPVANSSRPNTA